MKIRAKLVFIQNMDIRHGLLQHTEDPRPYLHEFTEVFLIQFQGIILLVLLGILIKRVRQLLFHPLGRLMVHRQEETGLKMLAGCVIFRPFIVHHLHKAIVYLAVVILISHMAERVKIQDVTCTQPADDVVQVRHVP